MNNDNKLDNFENVQKLKNFIICSKLLLKLLICHTAT